MNNAQRNAFRAARYIFETPVGELVLKVDETNPQLTSLLRNLDANCAAVITAFNPHGNLQALSINRRAQELLQQDLASGGFTFLPGRNEDPGGQWPVEESFLILQINLAASQSYAEHYDQLAFLWMDVFKSTPRLVETAAPAP